MISDRNRSIELMDGPTWIQNCTSPRSMDCDASIRSAAAQAILWPSIAAAASDICPRALRVLDLACGGGDNAFEISRLSQLAGLNVEVHGCDVSPLAIAKCRESARTMKINPDNFFQLNVLQQPLPDDFDVIMCSLFLHHLSKEDAGSLIRKMADAAQQLVLISDLRLAYLAGIGFGLGRQPTADTFADCPHRCGAVGSRCVYGK